MAPQAPNYKRLRQRIRRTLNYGSRYPRSLHFPLSELMVDYFEQASPFDYLSPSASTRVSRRGFADPCSLVVALVYLDRVRIKDKEFFETSDPLDLYLPALVLASKFLHDSDVIERANNSEWADAMDLSLSHLNSLEWSFVDKLDWDSMVEAEEFERWLHIIETWTACYTLRNNGFGTYNELQLLSAAVDWRALGELIATSLAVCAACYTALLLSVLAAPVLISLPRSSYSPPLSTSDVALEIVRSLPSVCVARSSSASNNSTCALPSVDFSLSAVNNHTHFLRVISLRA